MPSSAPSLPAVMARSPSSFMLSRLTMPMSTLTRCSMSWYRPLMLSLLLAPVPVASLPRTTSSVSRSSRRSPTPMKASSVPMPCRLVARYTSWFSRTRSPMPSPRPGSRYRPSDRGRDGVSWSGARRRDFARAALSISLNNMSDANELISFIASMSGEGNLRVEENLGEGYVRLRVSEAERRQAKHDIQHVEDIVIEMLRNARDAGATRSISPRPRKMASARLSFWITVRAFHRICKSESSMPRYLQAREHEDGPLGAFRSWHGIVFDQAEH